MQNHIISQKIIYYFLFYIILNVCLGCHQKATNEGLNQSLDISSAKTTEVPNKKRSSVEKKAIIYRSNDMGKTWFSFAKGIPKDATLSGIKQDGNKIYISTDYHGLYLTTNGQDNWISLNTERLKGLDINCIEVDGNNLVIGTFKHGILISNDGGTSWKKSKKDIEHSPIRAFIKSGNKILAGTDSGIFESTDMGDTWLHVYGQIQILGFTSLNGSIYAATQNGVLMSNGNSKKWESIYNGDALHDIGNDGKYIYAMTIGQQLLKTQNDGALWENAQSGITRPPNFYTNEIQHIGTDIFSAQWIGIYHSSNHGNSWQMLNGLPDSTAFSTLAITDFGIIAGISIR